MSKENDNWLIQFVLLITVSAIIAGISYYLQFYVLPNPKGDEYGVMTDFIRMLRMTVTYVIPTIIFTYYNGDNLSSLGLRLPIKKTYILSFLGGIFIYSIAGYIFVKNKIFFSGWIIVPWRTVWLDLFLIGIMASITDYWTRGFILLQLYDRYGKFIAILGQNVVWFIIHLYEIDLLIPYIGLGWSIMLTLFLGITGDLIAIKSRSIYGLMIGHTVLNLLIILGAKGIIVL